MQVFIKRSTATFIVLFVLNLLVTVLAFYVLPKRFFYDAVVIALDKGNEIGFFGSYPLTILFYKITGLRYLPFSIVGLIQFPFLMYVLYIIGIPTDFQKLNIKNILVYLGILMIAIFMSMPSKEFITYLFVSLIVFLFLNEKIAFRTALFSSLFLLALFGILYRPYFFLIPIIAIVMYGISGVNFKSRTLTTVFYGIAIAIFLSLIYGLVTGHYFSEISREVVNSF